MNADEKDSVEVVVLKRTVAALEEVQLDDEFRLLAFEKVFDLVTGEITLTGSAAGAAQPPSPSFVPSPTVPQGRQDDDGDILSKISARLKLDRAIVDEVYGVKDGELVLHMSPSKLDDTRSGGTKEIALVLAAGRQAAGIEEWTSYAEIRQWCDHMNRLDASNFAGTMAEMDSLLRTTGSPRKREVQLRATGWEEASKTVRKLVHGDQG